MRQPEILFHPDAGGNGSSKPDEEEKSRLAGLLKDLIDIDGNGEEDEDFDQLIEKYERIKPSKAKLARIVDDALLLIVFGHKPNELSEQERQECLTDARQQLSEQLALKRGRRKPGFRRRSGRDRD